MAKKPKKAILRTYQVGFGDCFLLTFQYAPDDERHILIDFGSTGFPASVTSPDKQMLEVANDIKERCNGQLDIVVATHRHKDHISGFTTNKEKNASGDIIRGCEPKVVIQPWTEDPALAEDALTSGQRLAAASTSDVSTKKSHAKNLLNMGRISNNLLKEAEHFSDTSKFLTTMTQTVASQIKFLAEDAGFFAVTEKKAGGKSKKISNISAVENLNTMTGKHHYVEYGSKLNLAALLPGVKVTVLGPPTIKQYEAVQKQRSKDKEEFWMLYAATSDAGGEFIDGEETLFPQAKLYDEGYIPPRARWFVRNLRAIRGDQLLQIARTMDQALNNTSVILLFEVGDEKLLFPGDAQIENWEYALKFAPEAKKNINLLKETTLYKVGHHGSRNATPKTLWECFEHKSDKKTDEGRLQTVVSTMEGKHGTTVETAVPRKTLVDALDSESSYYTTQKLSGGNANVKGNKFITESEEKGLWGQIEIDLRK